MKSLLKQITVKAYPNINMYKNLCTLQLATLLFWSGKEKDPVQMHMIYLLVFFRMLKTSIMIMCNTVTRQHAAALHLNKTVDPFD